LINKTCEILTGVNSLTEIYHKKAIYYVCSFNVEHSVVNTLLFSFYFQRKGLATSGYAVKETEREGERDRSETRIR